MYFVCTETCIYITVIYYRILRVVKKISQPKYVDYLEGKKRRKRVIHTLNLLSFLYHQEVIFQFMFSNTSLELSH